MDWLISVVIIFPLVSNRRDHDVLTVNNLEQCNVARSAKWNKQLTQKWTLTRFAACERGRAQGRNAVLDGLERPRSQFKVAVDLGEFGLQHETKQLLQILGRLRRQSNPNVHRLPAA